MGVAIQCAYVAAGAMADTVNRTGLGSASYQHVDVAYKDWFEEDDWRVEALDPYTKKCHL